MSRRPAKSEGNSSGSMCSNRLPLGACTVLQAVGRAALTSYRLRPGVILAHLLICSCLPACLTACLLVAGSVSISCQCVL